MASGEGLGVKTSLQEVAELITRLRFWFFLAIILVFVTFELNEHPLSDGIDWFGVMEVAVFLILLVSVDSLLGNLQRSNEEKTRTAAILNIKHRVNQQLLTAREWTELVQLVEQFPQSIASVTAVSLEMFDPSPTGDAGSPPTPHPNGAAASAELCPQLRACQDCILQGKTSLHSLNGAAASAKLRPQLRACQDCILQGKTGLHSLNGSHDSARTKYSYCLPLVFGGAPLALLQIETPAAKALTSEQADLLNGVAQELGLALGIARQRQAIAAHRVAAAAREAMREVSHDLHDTLGQNLSYLQFKLDQLTRAGSPLAASEYTSELQTMKAVASESNELLRGTLISLQPSSQSHLLELLSAHSRQVSERGSFEIQLSSIGTPVPLPSSTLRQVFYVFREAVNNVERHAHADQVKVSLQWAKDRLSISLFDNGQGFNPLGSQAEGHFGIQIMQERMHAIGGSVTIESFSGKGTLLTLALPLVA